MASVCRDLLLITTRSLTALGPTEQSTKLFMKVNVFIIRDGVICGI